MALSRGRQWIAVHELGPGRAGTGGLGPNILTNPNGAYGSAPWSLQNLTETTGQTDPFGGTTASLLTDTATNALHGFSQVYTGAGGARYLATAYFKPGTYTGGMTFLVENNTTGASVNNSGVSSSPSNVSNISVVSVGGFFKLTYNFISGGGALGLNIYFGLGGVGIPAYAGTLQNQTFWGVSLQRVL